MTRSVLNRQEKGRERRLVVLRGECGRGRFVGARFLRPSTAIGLTQHVVHKNHWKTENLLDEIEQRRRRSRPSSSSMESKQN